jgi:hypothetical protein
MKRSKNIVTEQDITGPVCLHLRQSLGMSQTDFWGAVGWTQTAGSRHELGKHAIQRPVRILIYLTYVAKVKVDASTEEGVMALYRLAELQQADQSKKDEA